MDILKKANIPESWWPNCHITEDGMIFTPVFDDAGAMTKTGEQAYENWLQHKPNTDMTPMPIDQRVAAIEDAITELMFGGAV